MDAALHNTTIYNRHVREYMMRFMNLGLYKDTFEYFSNIIPPNGTVLELGCGPGNVIKYLHSKRNDLFFLGIDLAPQMIQEAKRQNPGLSFQVMDVRNMEFELKLFDAIIVAFCLPYIPATDMPALFIHIARLLPVNGLLYLSFMEGPGTRSGFERTSFTGDEELYIQYYERSEIEAILIRHGFTVEAFFTKDYYEPDGSVTLDLIYIARKA